MSFAAKDTSEPRNALPSIDTSEKRIAEQAPSALRVLHRLQATDLIDVLGLTAYSNELHLAE